MVIGFARVCLSDWHRTGPSVNIQVCVLGGGRGGGGGRKCPERKDERSRANLGMVIDKTDTEILDCFTLSGCFPLLVSYEILGFIVKRGSS